ncbi:MAG: glycosyl transferase [Bacteroidetes bacterium RIFOXYA12_FULL_35_11]|nr:MAG: glycosyl transferase [Bacteroidetes bacterium GWF2_35_48]OFY79302.1 MAG: glycosyl transferase [Bacteroidetes bacterium RIFOXYA12_FULL_35_11]OFY93957.1 MAG: glycosyl transferase [Bacteroidetes bacterium RIFOXYC12_FULL_35_7]
MNTTAKFLIIRFSSIGDIVLTSPVIRCMKQQIEDAEIHFLTKPQFAGIVTNNPYITKVHVLKDNFQDTIEELKDECFDYVIDLHHSLRSSRVISQLGLGAFKFKKLNIEKWLYVNFKINRLPDIHIVDRYLNTVAMFDVANDGKGLDYFIPEKDEINLKTIAENIFPKKYIAFVIGAKHFTKQLPTEKIVEICNRLNAPVLLLGGKEDAAKGEEIITKTEKSDIVNICGKFSLNQSASIVKQAGVVITHDTGLMHIAAAFHKKIISVWGNTIPAFGMYPYMPGEGSEIVEIKNLKCRPCTKIGFRICPKNHFLCMRQIDENKIADLALKLMQT